MTLPWIPLMWTLLFWMLHSNPSLLTMSWHYILLLMILYVTLVSTSNWTTHSVSFALWQSTWLNCLASHIRVLGCSLSLLMVSTSRCWFKHILFHLHEKGLCRAQMLRHAVHHTHHRSTTSYCLLMLATGSSYMSKLLFKNIVSLKIIKLLL